MLDLEKLKNQLDIEKNPTMRNRIADRIEKLKKENNSPEIFSTDDTFSGRVYSTYEYAKFKLIDGNRKIDRNNLKRLIESMKIEDAKIPILVTENYYVIDGQHRLQARKQLMLPVYYIVSSMDASADSIILSTMAQKPLTFISIAELRANTGNENYKKLLEFTRYYKIPITMAITLISKAAKSRAGGYSGGNTGHRFKLGEFKADDIEFAESLGDYLQLLYKETNSNIIKSKYFVNSLLVVLAMKDFNKEHFASQITKHKHLMENKATSKQYQNMIHEIYNYRVPEKKRINLRPI